MRALRSFASMHRGEIASVALKVVREPLILLDAVPK